MMFDLIYDPVPCGPGCACDGWGGCPFWNDEPDGEPPPAHPDDCETPVSPADDIPF